LNKPLWFHGRKCDNVSHLTATSDAAGEILAFWPITSFIKWPISVHCCHSFCHKITIPEYWDHPFSK
jgi:hypothetical protein